MTSVFDELKPKVLGFLFLACPGGELPAVMNLNPVTLYSDNAPLGKKHEKTRSNRCARRMHGADEKT